MIDDFDIKRLAREMMVNRDADVVVIGNGAKGEVARTSLKYPLFASFMLNLPDEGAYMALHGATTKHAWGYAMPYGALLVACDAIATRYAQDPTVGVDDGLHWDNDMATRDLVAALVADIQDLKMQPHDSIFWVFHPEEVCNCSLCGGQKIT